MKRVFFLLVSLLICAPNALWADAIVMFNEIMYHPATNESSLEWVELRNQLAVDVDISEWTIRGGIQYRFASNTIVPGRGYLVLAINPAALLAVSPGLAASRVVGPFTGRLNNAGEDLRLYNNSGRIMDTVSYGVDGGWPVGPDGTGVSLAKRRNDTASDKAGSWVDSEQLGGTPGVDNFVSDNPPETRVMALDQTWRVEASGTDLGTVWRNPAYDDATWLSRASVSNRSIPIFNTGVNANGAALPVGQLDTHYTLVAAAQGSVPTNPIVMTPNSAWAANSANSTWIGVINSGAANVNAGAYDFRTTFSLDGLLPATAQLNLSFAVDNDLTNVFLNGVAKGIAYSGFDALSAIQSITSGFSSGVNTLEFKTVNAGTTPNPGGFRAVITSSALARNSSPLPGGLTTYYFRKTFSFAGNPNLTRLRLSALVADGAVVYLNGQEVYRQNLPPGDLSASTPALSDVAAPAVVGPVAISSSSLLSGQNVLAVEVHQAPGSTDEALAAVELFSAPVPAPELPVAFNEAASATNQAFFVELVNYGTNALSLDGYVLLQDGVTNRSFVLGPGANLAPGGFLAISNQFGTIHAAGDRFHLLTPARDRVISSVVLKDSLRGRYPAGTGDWLFPSVATPGAANTFAFRNEIVINEIMYDHRLLPGTNGQPGRASNESWFELFNRSSNTVNLTGWEIAGGIGYRFSFGQLIAPGAYLVVAEDAAALRAAFPGASIVGNINGRLSQTSDSIILKDPSGNPADEVRYFANGRWPLEADGGGSSLELRDPNADNSVAEAWAASDESGKSSWQTYSYQIVAQASPQPDSGLDTRWRDFIFGLQSAGECLLDDISIVWSPTNNSTSIVGNGDFENGLSGWRVLGTHGHSEVIIDPDNGGNHVLHLVATGPQEHMHNHIEATLLGTRQITNGHLYRVSFRAKWLNGNHLLNTRCYFDRVARTTPLDYPTRNGTPGAPNSRLVANIGPTFSGFRHQRPIPNANEPVTVSVSASDPQGVAAAQVFYSVNGANWASAPMAALGNDRYSGIIPGQSAGAVVQFYVRATDGLGAAATFPAHGPTSGALYKVNDGQADVNLAHNVRIILTPANTDLLHALTNVMSNDLLPCTVIYDESRVYYDIGVHLRGSQRGRYSDIRTGFHLTFNPDDLFRGTHPVMLIDRSGAGDATANRQEEIVLKHILNRAGGIPGTYGEIARILAPRGAVHSGPAQFFPRHEDLFLETAFENGGDGQMFEMELIYYPTTANADGYKLPQPDNVVGLDITDLGDDKERYRYNHMLKNHREEDDYSRFIALAKAWSLNGPALEAATRVLMDLDEWTRAYALVSLCSVGDMYSFGNNHNFFAYSRASDSKFVYFPWDMDFAFTRGASGALIGDQNVAKIMNLISNKRRLYAHMLDIMNVSFNPGYMAYWTDHYDNFAPGQNYITSFNTIRDRVPFVRSTINSEGGNAPFNVTSSNIVDTSSNLVTITGTAPVTAYSIRINGVEYPLTWTSLSAWTARVPLTAATTELTVQPYDLHGDPTTNAPRKIVVNYTGAAPDPAGSVVINEIMYNPVAPDAAYIELFNASPTLSFDLSGWRLNGVDFTFPRGTILPSRGLLVVAASIPGYFSAYGVNGVAPIGSFSGNLQNDGETLTLLRPGPGGTELVVNRVRYESTAPWPTTRPNGGGGSLQLIDSAQDTSRVGNWSDGSGWRFYSFTALAGAAPNTMLVFLANAGDVYIDNLSFVLGPKAESGFNYFTNGGFEDNLTGWNLQGNHTNSTLVEGISYGGTHSLHLVATAPGGSLGALAQPMTGLVTTNTYTISFWYLPSTNGTGLRFRLTSIFTIGSGQVDYRPVFSSPGLPNTISSTLPPFPPVWLNEALPDNLTGLVDNFGEREPWVEIYNGGTNGIDLTGYYLSSGYVNLTQWPFPAGASLQPGEFKVVFVDGEAGESTPTAWHTSFRLTPGAGSISLNWSPTGVAQVLDYLNYTNVTPGRSYGDYPDGQVFDRQEFYISTPGAPNNNQAPPLVVRINEWMAANANTLLNTNHSNRFDDWVELYNPGNTPADLAGFYLTDNLSNKFRFQIPPGYVIAPHGYLLVWADEQPSANAPYDPDLHVNFRLEQAGEQIGLFASDGTLIDAVTFEPQFTDISQGRVPNGSGPSYYMAVSTPRAANSSWANRYPTLAPIDDVRLVTGQTLSFTAQGDDPDLPLQVLRYSLDDDDAPPGALIDAVSGQFTWTAPQVAVTNRITVRVTDNGTPALRAARTFQAIVTPGFRVSGVTRQPNGDVALSIGATVGKTYRVEYTEDLTTGNWTAIVPDQVAASATLVITDPGVTGQQRFYRVRQVD
jgi:hypothetical protein